MHSTSSGRLGHLVARAALLAAVAACGDSGTEPDAGLRVARVDVAAVPDTLGVGDSLQLTGRALGLAGRPLDDEPIGWTTRAAGVLQVTSTGVARAVAPGDAWVVAWAGDGRAQRRDSVRVHVESRSRSLRLVVPGDTIATDRVFTVRLDVDTALGAAVGDSVARFRSSDLTILAVDSVTGVARFLTDADASITVTAGGRTASVALHSVLERIETGGVAIRKLAMGWGFDCGLDAAGKAYCWGLNNRGQLGRGTVQTGGAWLPFAPVASASRFTTLSAGRGGTCGVTTTGGVECWGGMSYPFVRETSERGLPRPIPAPDGAGRFTDVFSGVRAATCALDDAGRLYCWGDNTYGGLPFVETIVFPMRALPAEYGPMVSMASGELHGCSVALTGMLYCWGWHSLTGASGTTSAERATPVAVPALPEMASVGTSFQGTCALDRSGGTWCGGYLYDGSSEGWHTMARVTAAPAFTKLVVGLDNVCGLTSGGEAWCWRVSFTSPTGLAYPGYTPSLLSRRHKFVELAAGAHGVCGVTIEGTLVCRESRSWGFQ